MNTNEQYDSREQIEQLLTRLPHELDQLLAKCSSVDTSTTPDYTTFRMEAFALLKPFGDFDDDMFHAGEIPTILRTAARVFARRKQYFSEQLKRRQKALKKGKPKELKAYKKLKLLMQFFGYADEYPNNVFKLYDLEYQLDRERDSGKRMEILSELNEMFGETSTALYVQALGALHSGDLDEAIELCERAIEKFPDNTPAYSLQAEIHHAKAQKALQAGLKREPKDKTLRVALKLGDHLQILREKYTDGLLDTEDLINNFEQIIEENIEKANIDLNRYKENVRKKLDTAGKLHEKTMKFLCTAEYLIEEMPPIFDHSPTSIEFCKVIENEFHERLFVPFKTWCEKNTTAIEKGTKDSRFLYQYLIKDNKLTLGRMATNIRNLADSDIIHRDQLLQKLDKFIDTDTYLRSSIKDNELVSLMDNHNIQEYRNKAAHKSLFSIEKAQETKEWCYSILRILTISC